MIAVRRRSREAAGVRGAGEDERELVPALPRDQIPRAQQPRHRAGDVAQQLVAGGMTERVVDELEVVEVDVQDRGGLTMLQQSPEVTHQCAARGQAGELIAVGGRVERCRERAESTCGTATHRRRSHTRPSSGDPRSRERRALGLDV